MANTNPLLRALRRLGASNQELAERDRQRLVEESGATPISAVRDREKVALRGFVTALTMEPRGGTPWLEATFSDGSEAITLIWMGRREIPGVNAGREMTVEGRVLLVDGERRMYNPRYSLIATA
ncbi:MAG: DNA-binding protein [Propionicimonas sp.]